MVVIHRGWLLEHVGDICKLKCLANQDQANQKKEQSGVVESGGDFGKAESMCQSRGQSHLVNIDG